MIALTITPQGHLLIEDAPDEGATNGKLSLAGTTRVREAFEKGQAEALLYLGAVELTTALPVSIAFARDFARDYLTKLSRAADLEPVITAPAREELAFVVMTAPPMKGLEYLNADVLAEWWAGLDTHAREVMRNHPGGAAAYLREKN